MKTSYQIYEVGSDVWAISRYAESDHCAIYQARVGSVYIEKDKSTNSVKIEYWLDTPSGENWGAEVDSEFVSDSFEELVTKMRKEWMKNSNTHGENRR